jgi:hypothetical protein
MASPPPPAPRRRFRRLREIATFALIANLVLCGLLIVPLLLAALYQVQRTGWVGDAPRVWRVLGLSDWAVALSLLAAAATPPVLGARRRRALRRRGDAARALSRDRARSRRRGR